MKVIGLTGGIGAGKSYVADCFAKCGFAVIDADAVCRGIYEPGGDCLAEVVEAFGTQILRADGTLDRGALGAIVFSDRDALDRLNAIAHRYITARIEERITAFTNTDKKGIILDAPQLYEAGIHHRCDAVIAVIAPEEQRIRRACERDGLEAAQVRARIGMQHDDAFFLANADYIISNGDGEDLSAQIENILKGLMEDK